MKTNWIKEVLVDLSKSALDEGRVELFDAIKSCAKLAASEEEENQNEKILESKHENQNKQTAEIFDLYDYRRRLRMSKMNCP